MSTLYEQRSKAIQKQNETYLSMFEQSLKGLSDKVKTRHLSNMDTFLNWFLVDYVEHDYSEDRTSIHDTETRPDFGPAPMEDGMGEIGEFLGYFLIKKCMDSTPASIKSSAASIKKFYKCMLDNGQYGSLTEDEFRDAYKDMVEHIKDRLEDWMADCAQYNDLDQPSPFQVF